MGEKHSRGLLSRTFHEQGYLTGRGAPQARPKDGRERRAAPSPFEVPASLTLKPGSSGCGLNLFCAATGYFALAQSIRTLNEQIEQEDMLHRIRNEVSRAQRIVFLGFH